MALIKIINRLKVDHIWLQDIWGFCGLFLFPALLLLLSWLFRLEKSEADWAKEFTTDDAPSDKFLRSLAKLWSILLKQNKNKSLKY